ncbi:LOW QUALITY PROTEIN: hypothetical protein PanWU01x14_234520, partial [Parasponia andersonii]
IVATSKEGVDLVEKGGLGNGRGQVSEHHFGSIHIHLHHKTLENNYDYWNGILVIWQKKCPSDYIFPALSVID